MSLDLATLESHVVRAEETEYRVKPVWTPDGKSILYVTEDKGSNDIRIISAAGGDPIELTIDDEHHEMSPTVSPDGTRFAFVAYRDGVPKLYTARHRRRTPERVARSEDHVASLDGTDRARSDSRRRTGRPAVARTRLRRRERRPLIHAGRALPPSDDGDGPTVLPYARERRGRGAGGRTTIEAVHGWEYKPKAVTVDVRAGATQTATIALDG